ncbi:unnamed protein product [Rotaria sp. Silwood1]|nr:unnamed protein product [Rotaria sp. Silwood1]
MDYQLRSPRGKLVLNVYRQRENQSSTNVAQTQSGLIIDNETALSSEIIKEQLNSVADIITQAIIEVPTKHLLHLKELAPSDLRVLARSDDNDPYSTCTLLVQPMPATILLLGSTSCEHAPVWKLVQR